MAKPFELRNHIHAYLGEPQENDRWTVTADVIHNRFGYIPSKGDLESAIVRMKDDGLFLSVTRNTANTAFFIKLSDKGKEFQGYEDPKNAPEPKEKWIKRVSPWIAPIAVIGTLGLGFLQYLESGRTTSLEQRVHELEQYKVVPAQESGEVEKPEVSTSPSADSATVSRVDTSK